MFSGVTGTTGQWPETFVQVNSYVFVKCVNGQHGANIFTISTLKLTAGKFKLDLLPPIGKKTLNVTFMHQCCSVQALANKTFLY